MCRAREAMAMTSFVGVRETENGLEGSAMLEGGMEGECGWWMCRVESQEAEMRSLCSRL